LFHAFIFSDIETVFISIEVFMLEYAQTVEQDCTACDSKTRSCSQFCL